MEDSGRDTSPVMRWYFVSFGLSMLGTGLWLPLNAVFLAEERGLSAAGVGAYYSITAVAGFAATIFSGSVVDRTGPFRPLAIGGIVQGAGIALLIAVDSTVSAYVAAAVFGVGTGTFFAVQTAAMTRLFGLKRLSSLFGRQYQIMNLGIGAGALVLGGLVHEVGYTGYVIAFSINAATYVIHALNVVGPVRRKAIAAGMAEPHEPPAATRPDPLGPYRDPRFLPVILIQFCVVMFGYAQIEAVLPVVFRDETNLPLWGVTAYITANCVGIVAFQPWSTRWVGRMGPERGLRAALVLWLVAVVPAALSPHLGGDLLPRLVAVMAFAVIFAVGETLVAPSMQPMAAMRAPKERLASYTAAVSTTFALGMIVGPPISLPVFAQLGVNTYWLLIIVGLVLGMLAVRLAQTNAQAESPTPVQVHEA